MVDPSFKLEEEPVFKEIDLVLYPESGEDISDETVGNSAGGILTRHRRWRV